MEFIIRPGMEESADSVGYEAGGQGIRTFVFRQNRFRILGISERNHYLATELLSNLIPEQML